MAIFLPQDRAMIVVLGGPPIRSKSLESLINASPTMVVHLPSIEEVIGEELNYDAEAAVLAYGRHLSEGEIACSAIHLNAYRVFLDSKDDWLLVLEDDAELQVPLTFLLETSKHWRDVEAWTGPKVVSLYSPTHIARGCRRRSSLSRLLVAPVGTVAYWINRQAAQEAVGSSVRIISSADWPPWSTRVSFWRSGEVGWIEHPSGTTILNREDTKSVSKPTRLLLVVRAICNDEYRPQEFQTRTNLLKFVLTPWIRRLFSSRSSH